MQTYVVDFDPKSKVEPFTTSAADLAELGEQIAVHVGTKHLRGATYVVQVGEFFGAIAPACDTRNPITFLITTPAQEH